MMKGTIYKWYAGQEHASPDFERKILDSLMQDAIANKFDAVIVADISRWSRDNARGSQDLKVLQKNGIRFFERSKEYDLNNEIDYFQIALFGIIGQMQAHTQTRKSVLNKIARARDGHPTCGRPPYGRTYDKEKKTWGIDLDKQKIIKDCAKRYISGEPMRDIAKSHGMNLANLHLILKSRCGDTWEQKFLSKRVNIDETVTIKIPRLLPEETIRQIHQHSEGNRTYLHGQLTHPYLLSRMIFCEGCGYAALGQTSHKRRPYYRHSRASDCRQFDYVPADVIEAAVINDIFQMLGDKPRIEQAAKDAVPNLEEMDDLRQDILNAEQQLLKIKKAKDKLLDQVETGILHGDELKERMEKHREREAVLKSKIETGRAKLASIPSKEAVAKRSGFLLRLAEDILKSSNHLDASMTFADKKRLLQYAFAGKDSDNRRHGVYIKKAGKRRWTYTIRGLLYNSEGVAPRIVTEPFIYEPDEGTGIMTLEESKAGMIAARKSYMERHQDLTLPRLRSAYHGGRYYKRKCRPRCAAGHIDGAGENCPS